MRTAVLVGLLAVGCGAAEQEPAPAAPTPPAAAPAPETPPKAAPPAPKRTPRKVSCMWLSPMTVPSPAGAMPVAAAYYDVTIYDDMSAAAVGRMSLSGPQFEAVALGVVPGDTRYAALPLVITTPDGEWRLSADRTQDPIRLRVERGDQVYDGTCSAR